MKLSEDERAAQAWDKARARQAAAAIAAHGTGEDATYTAQPGDTLESIAAAIYGSNELAPGLWDANSAVIGSDPAALTPGTVLVVPVPTIDPAAAPAS
jgi:nucleoid-associated protein YgaU